MKDILGTPPVYYSSYLHYRRLLFLNGAARDLPIHQQQVAMMMDLARPVQGLRHTYSRKVLVNAEKIGSDRKENQQPMVCRGRKRGRKCASSTTGEGRRSRRLLVAAVSKMPQKHSSRRSVHVPFHRYTITVFLPYFMRSSAYAIFPSITAKELTGRHWVNEG